VNRSFLGHTNMWQSIIDSFITILIIIGALIGLSIAVCIWLVWTFPILGVVFLVTGILGVIFMMKVVL
jgi:hypothetical protein